MPFSPQQIYPEDLNPSQGIGVDLPLNGPSVFKSNYQTKDAIKNNLINYFLTNPGERYLNTEFGGGLRNFIFEQLANDNLFKLEKRIQTQLNLYFSNINILSLDIIKDNVDLNEITVQLKYSVINTNINDELTIQL